MSGVHKRERGIALILVILALILLSAIGLALMFSADTETSIAANYRDKQVALYAAQAALQEARDRINRFNAGSPYYIPSPAGMGTATNPINVIYIINPGPGETANDIKPWDPTNKYFDTAICGGDSPALPTSSLCAGGKPVATSGYKVYDDSQATISGVANPYHPVGGQQLPFKWVRIIYKADNSTPVHVADSNAGTQVCWDEAHGYQMLLPTGWSVDCSGPGGQVETVALQAGNDGGHGYSVASPPAVTITGGGGSGATANAIVTPVSTSSVESITIDNAGAGYDVAPTIQISPPDFGGTQATAQAVISPLSGGAIDTLTLTDKGGCFQSATAPTVSISGGSGSGATATVAMTAQTCVYAWTASGSCKAQAGNVVNVTGTGGFASTITFKNGNGNVSGTGAVTNGGTGLSPASPPTLSIGGCTVTPSFTYGYKVNTLNKGASGQNYSNPQVTFLAGNVAPAGGLPKATATTTNTAGGKVISITITNKGSGYSAQPTVTFVTAGASGGGAQGTPIMGDASSATGTITGFQVTNGGSGYTSAPSVTVAGTGGAQAVATVSQREQKSNIYLVTAFAHTKGGSIALQEMEIANLWAAGSDFNFKIPGAMTLAGPNPNFTPPSSANMVISGVDANSCGGTSNGKLPAIGVYNSNPPPLPPALNADQTVIQSLPKPGNFQGINSTADVHDVSQSIGDPASAAAGLEAEVQAIIASAPPQNHITGDANGTCSGTTVSSNSCIPLGTSTQDAITVVDGNASIGPVSGRGILVVRGDLVMSGDFSWSGVILVVGTGNVTWNGGGNGQVTGAVYVANTQGGSGTMTLGSPDAAWNGGGTNGIQYDHCRADNLLNNLPPVKQPSNKPIRIISMRTLGNQ